VVLFWAGKPGTTKSPKLGVAKEVFAWVRILIKFGEVELELLVLVLEDVEDEELEEPPEVPPPPEEDEFELPGEGAGDEKIGAKGLLEGRGFGVKMGKLGIDGVDGTGVGEGSGVGVSATLILAIALLLLKGLESPLFFRSPSTSAVPPLFPVI